MSDGSYKDKEKLVTYEALDAFLQPDTPGVSAKTEDDYDDIDGGIEPSVRPRGTSASSATSNVSDFGREVRTRPRNASTASQISDFGKEIAPKEEPPLQIGYNILLLLFILGLTTGVVNGCTLWAGKMISLSQAEVLQSTVVGPMLFMMTTAAYAAASAFIIKKGGFPATIGSGMPEVKSLLLNDFHRSDFPTIVSFKILCVRLFSLVTAVGSGLSIGIAAPLVHVAICTAYTLLNLIPDFGEFLENHAIRKQVFTAAAAVGMTTVFNAPVGGLLLSLELTNTFYLVSNYWRSFMAATTGAVMYRVFMYARTNVEDQERIFQVDYDPSPAQTWELVFFALLGVISGLLALQYLKLHQAYFLFMKHYTEKYPVGSAAAVGAMTALLIYGVGAYSAAGVSESVIVYDLYQDASISTMNSRKGVNPLGALFAALIVRVLLTLMGTTLRISCGVFLPVLTLGALLGRIYGQILADIFGSSVSIYVSGYAMAGAVGFISGTTHTLSVALIVIEQTGQFNMLLPCLIVAVISAGITKSRSLSLYDQGMVNKGLESFDLLLKESGGFKYAADVLDKVVSSVHAKCTVNDLFELLGPTFKQGTFPVTSSARSYRLVGCLDRKDVYAYLKATFDREGLYAYVRQRLPADAHYDDRRNARMKQIQQRRGLTQSIEHSMQSIFHLSKVSADYDEDGQPLSPTHKGWFGMLNHSPHRSHRLADEQDDHDQEDEDDENHHDVQRTGSDDSGFGDHDVLKAKAVGESMRSSAVENPLLSSAPNTPDKPEGDSPPSTADSPSSPRSLKPSWSLNAPHGESLQNLAEGIKENFLSLTRGSKIPVLSPGNASKKTVEFTPEQQAKIDQILGRTINLTQEAALTINGFPFTAHRYTTMDQLYVLFEMVKVNVVFVVSNTKRLEGMITKHQLMQHLKQKVKNA